MLLRGAVAFAEEMNYNLRKPIPLVDGQEGTVWEDLPAGSVSSLPSSQKNVSPERIFYGAA